jgi:hypothetical protein
MRVLKNRNIDRYYRPRYGSVCFRVNDWDAMTPSSAVPRSEQGELVQDAKRAALADIAEYPIHGVVYDKVNKPGCSIACPFTIISGHATESAKMITCCGPNIRGQISQTNIARMEHTPYCLSVAIFVPPWTRLLR